MRPAQWRQAGKTFRYRDHRIFYRRAGAGAALLLIHGFPTASWDWHRLWEELSRRLDVIAPDMIGFGFSDKPRNYDYSLMDQATLHEELLAELGLSEVHVVAHDYGVTVAQELLARQAERARREIAGLQMRSLCLLNGGLFPEAIRPLPIQKLLLGPLGGLLVHLLSEATLRRSFNRIFGPHTRPGPAEIGDFWSLIEYNGGRRIFHRLIRYMAERRQYRDRWVGALQAATVPRRLVNGLVDPISGANLVQRYRELIPDPDVIELPSIGHYPQIEAPRETLQAILGLIDRSARTPD